MDDPLLKSLIKSSKSKWSEGSTSDISKKGLYEVWYIFIFDTPSNEAYWMRYTVLVPKVNVKAVEKANGPVAGLWLAYFNSEVPGKNMLLKNLAPLSEARGTRELVHGKRSIFSIGDSELSLDGARGTLATKSGKNVSWELEFSNFMEPYMHIPPVGRVLKLVSSIPSTTHPNIYISGNMMINGENKRLESVPGTMTHVTGSKYGKPWVYVHCNAFENEPDAYLEFTARGKTCLFGFHDGNEKIFFNKIRSLLNTTASWSITGLSFRGKDKHHEITGEVTLEKSDLLGVEYVGPRGEKIYCYNTEVANAEITITSRGKGPEASTTKKYVAKRCAAMETTWLNPLDGLPLVRWEESE